MAEDVAVLAGGCFWCTEAVFLDLVGVKSVESGYTGGHSVNPDYKQVCAGDTGHAEAIRITFDSREIGFDELLDIFFATHDPTQLNRQGNDVGTQYRSAIYTYSEEQHAAAVQSKAQYEIDLGRGGFGGITTEIRDAPPFFYAEDYHQQYLHKNPNGYCGIGGTGVKCSA